MCGFVLNSQNCHKYDYSFMLKCKYITHRFVYKKNCVYDFRSFFYLYDHHKLMSEHLVKSLSVRLKDDSHFTQTIRRRMKSLWKSISL